MITGSNNKLKDVHTRISINIESETFKGFI